MQKILFICDLKTCSSLRVSKVLKLFKIQPTEIILHYAYQIPKNTSDVISTHDKIKKEANEILTAQAKTINLITGIKTNINLKFGSTKSTLQRALDNDFFNCVISPQIDESNVVDSSFKSKYPNTSFIFTSTENLADKYTIDFFDKITYKDIENKFDISCIKKGSRNGSHVKFHKKFNSINNEFTDTIVIL